MRPELLSRLADVMFLLAAGLWALTLPPFNNEGYGDIAFALALAFILKERAHARTVS